MRRRLIQFLLVAAAAASTTAQELTVLGAGTTLSARLSGGERASYLLPLAADQFAFVVVDQQGIDVELRLVAEDGSLALRADSPNGRAGIERVAFVAPAAGRYRLDVVATSRSGTGGFTLSVDALRPATDRDRDHAAAERAFMDARTAAASTAAADRRRAIAEYERADRLFTPLDRPYEDGLTLLGLATVHMTLGQPRLALDPAARALAQFERAGAAAMVNTALTIIGGAHDILGDMTAAMQAYQRALSALGPDLTGATAGALLNNIGKLYADMADWERALDYFRRALPILREASDVRREGIAVHNIGNAYLSLGDFDRALENFDAALALRRRAGDKAGEADTLSLMGSARRMLGATDRAIDLYNQALVLRRAVGDPRTEATTLDNLGDALVATGRLDEGLRALEQARALHAVSGDRREQAKNLQNLGRAFTRDPGRSLEYSRRAAEMFRSIDDRNGLAGALAASARAERDLGDLDAARADAERALTAIEDVRGRVLSQDARALYLARQHDAYVLDIDILMRLHERSPTGGHDAQAFETSERSRARSLAELLAESATPIRRGVDAALLDQERRLSAEINAKADRIMRAAAPPAELETLTREVHRLETEYEEVRASIRRASPAYAALTQPAPASLHDTQRDLLDDETVLVEYSVAPSVSYAWVIDRTSMTTARLPGADELERLVRDVHAQVGARAPRANESAGEREQRVAAADRALASAAERLGAAIVGPFAARLAGRRVVFVPDGPLQYIPFAMLAIGPSSGARDLHPLIADSEIVTLPSASALRVQRQAAARPRPPRGIAVIADPVFDRHDDRVAAGSTPPSARPVVAEDDSRLLAHVAPARVIPRLPFTRQEASAILAVSGKSADDLQALDFDATKDLVVSGRLRDYRIVHFATHGYFDATEPALSSIVLSLVDRDGGARDGFLKLHELYDLDLPADLVVLSACETGLGRDVKGEGLVGLTRGFMYAGAARVVVSLWSVSDRGTAELMTALYREILSKHQRPAAALRAAQLALLASPAFHSPYYWAPFILQGEWR